MNKITPTILLRLFSGTMFANLDEKKEPKIPPTTANKRNIQGNFMEFK